MGVISVFGGVKGGIGKSVLAGNAAAVLARHARVIVADLDPQGTAMEFAAARAVAQETRPDLTDFSVVSLAALDDKGLRAELRRLAAAYDVVVVDPGGRDTRTQRTGLALASVAVFAFPPRGPELWTAPKVATMVEEVRAANEGLRAVSLVNRADPDSRPTDNNEALALLAEYGGTLEPLDVMVHEAKILANAYLAGLAAHEVKPLPKRPAEEIAALVEAVFGGLGVPGVGVSASNEKSTESV